VTIGRKVTTIAIVVTLTILVPGIPAKADQVRNLQWFISDLKLNQAHRITTGAGISVAVIDTGISPHRDLYRNLRKGTDTSPGGDGTGQDDEHGHGTRMAGLIAAHGRGTTEGALGVAPSSSLIPVRAAGKIPNGLGVPAGIKWAASFGADIISVSGSVSPSRELKDAVAAATQADAVIIAAAGNKSEDLSLIYPAAMPDVLAVGAIDRNGNAADFSITDQKVAICAPGVDMVTTDLNNKYAKGRGTSQATAIVAGAAALVRAKFPELSAPEVVHRLTATAKDNGPPGRDDQCGYGVLDIVKALTADVPPLDPAAGTGSGSAAPTGESSASVGPPGPIGAGASVAASPSPKASSSVLPVFAGIGSAVIVLGAALVFLVRRRRRSEPSEPSGPPV
jgi:type VII secretion-associated serine protease mycosin